MATIVEQTVETVPEIGDALELMRAARRFSPDEYARMGEAGILAGDEKLELLEGYVVNMMTRLPPHDVALRLMSKALDRLLPAGFDLRVQSAIALRASVPEPDCAIVIGDTRRYRDHHPVPAEIELVVEVADSSLQLDRTLKARIYAGDKLPRYWILNLPERTLEVLTEPTGDAANPAYAARQVLKEQEQVALVLGGQEVGKIAIAELLP